VASNEIVLLERESLARPKPADPGEALLDRLARTRRVPVHIIFDGGEHPPTEEAVEGVRGARRPQSNVDVRIAAKRSKLA
jgi:hypothetical protein